MSNLRELETLKSQYAEAEKSLSSSRQEQGAMHEALARHRESGARLEEALRASVSTGDHVRILREMSQDYLLSIQRWEGRQRQTELEHKAMFEAEVQALQGALLQRRAQLDGLGPAAEETEELQCARRECQELEAESARLADQLQQLARVQPWIAQRQSQVEGAQVRVLETWRGLQHKISQDPASLLGDIPLLADDPDGADQLAVKPWPPQPAPQPAPPSPQAQRPAALLTRGPLPLICDPSTHAAPHGAPGGHCAALPSPGSVLRSVRR